jgi:hypothetical protein
MGATPTAFPLPASCYTRQLPNCTEDRCKMLCGGAAGASILVVAGGSGARCYAEVPPEPPATTKIVVAAPFDQMPLQKRE